MIVGHVKDVRGLGDQRRTHAARTRHQHEVVTLQPSPTANVVNPVVGSAVTASRGDGVSVGKEKRGTAKRPV